MAARPTPERVLRALDRASDRIDAGDLEGAEEILEQLRRKLKREVPEQVLVEGELAAANDDPEDAVACFRRAAELAPEWAEPVLREAEERLELDEPEEAAALAERVYEGWPDDAQSRARAMLIAAEAYGDLDELARARAKLEELASLEPVDLDVLHDLAEGFFALEDPEAAERTVRRALSIAPDDADALHQLGGFLHERGDAEAATEAWLRVRELDLAAPRVDHDLSADALEDLAEEVLRELPDEVHAHLRNVPILVEDVPSEALVREGWDPRILGFFTGTPLPSKSHLEGQACSPDAAYLFLRNLENACASREQLEDEVRITILHETAHFFGLDDDELDRMGLG